MKVSEAIAALEAVKEALGDVDCLMAPTVGDKLSLMPYHIKEITPWKVNQGYGLIIANWPDGV